MMDEQQIRAAFGEFFADSEIEVRLPEVCHYFEYGPYSRQEGWRALVRGTTFSIDHYPSLQDAARTAYGHFSREIPVEDDGEYLYLSDPLPWIKGRFRLRHTAKATVLNRVPSVVDPESTDAPKVVSVYGRVYESKHNPALQLQAHSVTYADGDNGQAGVWPKDLEAC